MGLEMTDLTTNLRLGMKCKVLILFFEGFVGKKGKANLGPGMRPNVCRVPVGAR